MWGELTGVAVGAGAPGRALERDAVAVVNARRARGVLGSAGVSAPRAGVAADGDLVAA